MAHHTGAASVRATTTATKWAHPHVIVTATGTVIVKKAAGDGDVTRAVMMVPVTRPMEARGVCGEKARHVAMARREMAMKAAVIGGPMVLRATMVLVVNVGPMTMDRPVRRDPAPIGPNPPDRRKVPTTTRATLKPKPLESLVSTRGASLLVPANALPGLL
jgi:hypothetical protein